MISQRIPQDARQLFLKVGSRILAIQLRGLSLAHLCLDISIDNCRMNQVAFDLVTLPPKTLKFSWLEGSRTFAFLVVPIYQLTPRISGLTSFRIS